MVKELLSLKNSGFPVTSIFPADHWAELTVVNGESVGAEWYHVGTGCFKIKFKYLQKYFDIKIFLSPG